MKIASAIVAIPFETRTRIAVGAISIPLNPVERMLCESCHISHADFLRSKRRRLAGGDALSETTLGGVIESSGQSTVQTSFKERI